MNDNDLGRIERELSVTLPPEYRALQLSYPNDLDSDIREHEIFDDAERVIAETKLARSNDFMTSSWQAAYVVIGDSGCGDWYFLDTTQSPAPVRCWNHEIDEIEDEATDIQKWYIAIESDA